MKDLYVIAHNMRSTFNVGSLLRTAEGLGVKKVYLTGYTPYPKKDIDNRLPHISEKLTNQISKTALGAEKLQDWEQFDDLSELLALLAAKDIPVIALEQSDISIPLKEYKTPDSLALLLGEEVSGVPDKFLNMIDTHIHIPMYGKKESFNVIIAAAIALQKFRSD